MYEASALIAGGSALAAPTGLGRRRRARGEHRRRPAPRDARLRVRVLRLQRRRARDPHAARRRRRTGRLRRRRRPPRRRRAGRVLRRPAGADDQPAPGSAHALPRHRPAHRDSAWARPRARRSTSRCRPAPTTPAGCAPSAPSCPASCGRSSPDVLVTQCGCDTHHEDPLANLELTVDGQRAAIAELHQLAHEVTRAAVGGLRRRRLRAGALRAAHLDAPDRRGVGSPARPAHRDPAGLDRDVRDARGASVRAAATHGRAAATRERIEPGSPAASSWLDRAIAGDPPGRLPAARPRPGRPA